MFTVITPTGDRQNSLDLLGECLSRQTLNEPFRWVVVDDGEDATYPRIVPKLAKLNYTRLKPRGLGISSQRRNMRAALEKVHSESRFIAVCEDDDFYHPEHLAESSAALESCDATGERIANYYNVRTRLWREIPGSYHASLASTAFRPSCLDAMKNACEDSHYSGIDMVFFRSLSANGMRVKLRNSQHVIGIKGLPGRLGIGVGHRSSFAGAADPDLCKLAEWLRCEVKQIPDLYRSLVNVVCHG